MTEASARAADVTHLRDTVHEAWQARQDGAWPFAARIVGRNGTLPAAAGNVVVASGDPTTHAEMQAIRRATADAGQQLSGAILYASADPCAMCAGASHWAGLGRVVFGIGEPMLRRLFGSSPAFRSLTLSCRNVIASGGGAVAVVGPLLEDEVARPHAGFWRPADTPGEPA